MLQELCFTFGSKVQYKMHQKIYFIYRKNICLLFKKKEINIRGLY